MAAAYTPNAAASPSRRGCASDRASLIPGITGIASRAGHPQSTTARTRALRLITQFQSQINDRRYDAQQERGEHVERDVGRRRPLGHDARVDDPQMLTATPKIPAHLA